MILKTNTLEPINLNFSIDTSELEMAIQAILPDPNLLEAILNKSGVPEHIETLVTEVERIPEYLNSIAQGAQQDLQDAWRDCGESTDDLQEELRELPSTLGSVIKEQLEDSAESILDAFENDIKDNWEQLPETAAEELESALTNGFKEFINIAEQAQEYFRTEIQNALQESQQYLTNHVEDTLDSTIEDLKATVIERIEQELIASVVIMQIGSVTTTALSSFLPQIVIAYQLSSTINDFLESTGS